MVSVRDVSSVFDVVPESQLAGLLKKEIHNALSAAHGNRIRGGNGKLVIRIRTSPKILINLNGNVLLDNEEIVKADMQKVLEVSAKGGLAKPFRWTGKRRYSHKVTNFFEALANRKSDS
jgi:hypothetical protein